MTMLMRVFLAALCFIGLAHAQNEPLPADRIVAVVNDEVVTLHELRTRLNMALGQLQRQGIAFAHQRLKLQVAGAKTDNMVVNGGRVPGHLVVDHHQ